LVGFLFSSPHQPKEISMALIYSVALAIPFAALTAWFIHSGAKAIVNHYCD
jgi:hypothetical protein